MELIDLLNALTMAGLSPDLDDGQLIVRGPAERITPDMKEALRTHKSTLVGCLSSRQSDLAFADSPAAAEGLAECLRYFDGLVGDVTAARTGRTVLRWPCPLPTPCRRCGEADACAVVIHEGASIRRDCARCGAFRDFPVWQSAAEADEWVQALLDAVTMKAGRPGACDAEAALANHLETEGD